MSFTYSLKNLVFAFLLTAFCAGIIRQTRESVSIRDAVFEKLLNRGASLSFIGNTFEPKDVVSIDLTNCKNPESLIPNLVCFEQLNSLRINDDCVDIVSKFPTLRNACIHAKKSDMQATEVYLSNPVTLSELLELFSRSAHLKFIFDSSLGDVECDMVMEPRRQSMERYVQQISKELKCEFEVLPNSVVFHRKQ